MASLVNGKSAALGQVAMASFKNEGGLEKWVRIYIKTLQTLEKR